MRGRAGMQSLLGFTQQLEKMIGGGNARCTFPDISSETGVSHNGSWLQRAGASKQVLRSCVELPFARNIPVVGV